MSTHAELTERRRLLVESVAASEDERVKEACRNSLNLSEFCLDQSQRHRALPSYEEIELRNAEMHLDVVETILRKASVG